MFTRPILLILISMLAACSAWGQATFKPTGAKWKTESARPKEEKATPGQADYETALSVYQKDKSKDAIALCDKIIKTHKTGIWVEKATLLKARAQSRLGQKSAANDTLDRLLKKFPATSLTKETGDLKMAIGTALLDEGSDEGVRIFENMIEHNPHGPRVDEAQFKVGKYYLKHGYYEDAVDAFDFLIATYKKSRFLEEAVYLQAKASYHVGGGPQRDSIAYREASTGLKQYIRRNPSGKSAKESRKLLKEVNEKLACKKYLIAEYYRGQGHYRAAARYYRYVIKNYADTTWAGKSKKQLSDVRKRIPAEKSRKDKSTTTKTAGKK